MLIRTTGFKHTTIAELTPATESQFKQQYFTKIQKTLRLGQASKERFTENTSLCMFSSLSC